MAITRRVGQAGRRIEANRKAKYSECSKLDPENKQIPPRAGPPPLFNSTPAATESPL